MDNSELIINILINLFLTVVLYEIVPLILKCFMEKYYNREEARKIAIINTICVYSLITCYYIFVANEAKLANIGPAFLWGTVAFYILKNNKGLEAPNIEITCQISKTNEAQVKHSKHDIEFQNKTPHLLTDWKILTIVLGIVAVIMTVLFLYSTNDKKSLNEEIDGLHSTISARTKLLNKYKEKIDEFNEQIRFMDNHVAICPWDGSKLYHKYGCEYLDLSKKGMIYNIEQAPNEGYSACSHCVNLSNTYSSFDEYMDKKELK